MALVPGTGRLFDACIGTFANLLLRYSSTLRAYCKILERIAADSQLFCIMQLVFDRDKLFNLASGLHIRRFFWMCPGCRYT